MESIANPWQADANEESDPILTGWRDAWPLKPGVTHLNHGSFGLMPQCVREAQRSWQQRAEEDPMDFFLHTQEEALREATATLAYFVGASEMNVALVDNATAAMNGVASSFPLGPGDEVVLTNFEYGAVRRTWERACQRSGALLATAQLPFPPESGIEPILAAVSPRTRLVVVSHIFSEPATIMLLSEMIAALKENRIAVCVDGPHAVAQVPLALDRLGCDFYTASCHKWLCGPLGSGFLYVAPSWHDRIGPPVLGWGRLQPNQPECWREEFWWNGTRSLSAYLALPSAIEFLQQVGLDAFRRHGHALAKYGAALIDEVTGLAPPADRDRWFGTMTLAELPPGTDLYELRNALWNRYRIEAPIYEVAGRPFVRISAHLYNTREDMQHLARAIAELI